MDHRKRSMTLNLKISTVKKQSGSVEEVAMKTQKTLLRSIGLGLAIVVVLVVYAYGFQVTKVNFKETRSEKRLIVLARILRALAHPDIIEYEQRETEVDLPFYLPCPEGEVVIQEPDKSEPYLVSSVACAASVETITIEGYNFEPGAKGPLNFVTANDVTLQLDNFEVGQDGTFQLEVRLPTRQPVAEAQTIRAIARVPVGAPKFTDTAKVTWDKIIETVFLALLATTIGTALAIPISFLAARNLMSEVRSSLTSIAFTLIGWPVGIFLGYWVNRLISEWSSPVSSHIGGTIAAVIVSPSIAYALIRVALPQVEPDIQKTSLRIARILALAVSVILMILMLQQTAILALKVGQALIKPFGPFGFLGNFISQLGDVIQIITPLIVALIGGGVLGTTTSTLGQTISDRFDMNVVKIVNLISSAAAGALLCVLVGALINWFYQIDNPATVYYWPAGIGALLGLFLAARSKAKGNLPMGITLYFIMRTILNATRSVEPLVMVIVFVAWVGIGPFAGALALSLHTIAALAKLYSEQVESILPGPLEAITATGANRLQTIIFAVVPQIIPPYISFTMYRWDINVRMSTIIGFAGGGGIGFLLQQNINLLDYRSASAQMLAIAIVVASMDYVSSTLRERFV
jgi:phosphonate ABC transporter permease subunit PhnE